MRKIAGRLLATAAAVFVATGVGRATNIPLLTGVQDPSQLNATINSLIQSINSGTPGVLNVGTSAMATFATASEQTLQSYVMPANTLTTAGQSLRARCYGTLGANANSKTVRMYIANGSPLNSGAASSQTNFNNPPNSTAGATQTGFAFGSLASTVNGGSWELEVLATLASSGQTNFIGRGSLQNNQAQAPSINTILVSPVAVSSAGVSFASAVTINCAGTATTNSIGDVSNTELFVEAIR